MVVLEDKFGNKQATGVIEEEGDGKYSVTYAVPEDAETSSYMLNVCFRGVHIHGSRKPFCCNCVAFIYGRCTKTLFWTFCVQRLRAVV